jgi:hypothetical protein
LGLVFAHEIDTGACFYSLENFEQTKDGWIEAKTPGVALPMGFTPEGPFAILGNNGMYTFESKFMH